MRPAPINIEGDLVAKNWNKQDQAPSLQADSHDDQKQKQSLDYPPELANESKNITAPASPASSNTFTLTTTSTATAKADTTFLSNKNALNGRYSTLESLKGHFPPRSHHNITHSSPPSTPRSATEYTREEAPTHDCTKQGHQPQIIHSTNSPLYSAELGRLATTAKLPNISWLPVFRSRNTAATTETAGTTDTAVTTDIAARTSFVVCDVCGQSLPIVPTVAYRGGQTQVIRYDRQVFRRDFVRARQAPHRIREMARMAEEGTESKAEEKTE
ncbi:hypothetical protein BDV97DRAFT_146934 [Delphinella strobiligena]|nr:hypothetical protein BDV97DRAFT_146934 [Delphinella strobiligena]